VKRSTFVAAAALGATALLAFGPAQAAGYPDHPIRRVVPYAAGGGVEQAFAKDAKTSRRARKRHSSNPAFFRVLRGTFASFAYGGPAPYQEAPTPYASSRAATSATWWLSTTTS
jgi:hypothetical protein